MEKKLESTLTSLSKSLSSLWSMDSFRPFLSPFVRRSAARTVVSDEAMKLPLSGMPIRGTTGVETKVEERSATRQEEIERLIVESYTRPERNQPEDLQQAFRDVREAVGSVASCIDGDPSLSYRLYGARGYKTWSPEEFAEFREKVRGDRDIDLTYLLSLGQVLAAALVVTGFELSQRGSFSRWPEAIDSSLTRLLELRSFAHYDYEVRIFLNGPTIDSCDDQPVADLRVGDKGIEVTLSYATDSLLQPLVEYRTTPGYDKVNTVVRYRTRVPVDTGEQPYLDEYVTAAQVAELVVDALRLIRCTDDVGVIALEIIESDTFTPAIRKTWADRYQVELATHQPSRFDFGAASHDPLSDEELSRLQRTVCALLEQHGLSGRIKIALGRFRNSVERYSPSDPERLLEYAIALEALYLSELSSDRAELQYRLALRLARFLENDLDNRKKTFDVVRDLYRFRSRVAHGETLEKLKPADKERLERVLERAPVLVSTSILRLLDESPPATSDLGDFWKQIELG